MLKDDEAEGGQKKIKEKKVKMKFTAQAGNPDLYDASGGGSNGFGEFTLSGTFEVSTGRLG